MCVCVCGLLLLVFEEGDCRWERTSRGGDERGDAVLVLVLLIMKRRRRKGGRREEEDGENDGKGFILAVCVCMCM